MSPNHHADVVERWIARSVRAFWWAGGAFSVLLAIADLDAARDDRAPFAVAITAATIGAYGWMSRHPTSGLLFVCALGSLGAVLLVAETQMVTWWVLVVGAGVVSYRAPVTHLPFLAAAVVATAIVSAVRVMPDWLGETFTVLGLLLAVSVGVGAWRRTIGRQRALALVRARDAEREEIARELHDVVAHHVTAIVVQAQAGQLVRDPDAARATLAAVEAEGQAAMAAMRRMVASLRGSEVPTTSTDLAAELDDLATLLRATGIAVEETVGDVPSALAPTIVRLTREAFTNVRRHARRATIVRLQVTAGDGTIHWSVVDDGGAVRDTAPSVSSSGGGYGLVGLRERVEALGGRFAAGPHRDGWEVRAELPIGGAR